MVASGFADSANKFQWEWSGFGEKTSDFSKKAEILNLLEQKEKSVGIKMYLKNKSWKAVIMHNVPFTSFERYTRFSKLYKIFKFPYMLLLHQIEDKMYRCRFSLKQMVLKSCLNIRHPP